MRQCEATASHFGAKVNPMLPEAGLALKLWCCEGENLFGREKKPFLHYGYQGFGLPFRYSMLCGFLGVIGIQ